MADASTFTNLSFLQQNLNKGINASSDLEYAVLKNIKDKESPSIIFLQEPHIKFFTNRTKLSSIPQGYRAYIPRTEERTTAATTGNWPRTVILFNSNLNIWPIPQFTTRDCTVAQINLNLHDTFIVSLYLDRTKMSFPDSFIELLHNRGGKGLLIGVDSNSHSTLWMSEKSDNRGHMIEDLLAEHNLVLLNKGKVCTYRGQNGHSIIDLTFCDPITARNVTDWHVSEEKTSSDHQPIRFNITAQKEKIYKNPTGWRFSTTNWPKFQILVEASLENFSIPTISNYGILESKFRKIYKAINHALKLTCLPNRIHTCKNNRPMWWNESVSKARAKV